MAVRNDYKAGVALQDARFDVARDSLDNGLSTRRQLLTKVGAALFFGGSALRPAFDDLREYVKADMARDKQIAASTRRWSIKAMQRT